MIEQARKQILVMALLTVTPSCGKDWQDLAGRLRHHSPAGEIPVTPDGAAAPDAPAAPGPGQCHHLAPASGLVEVHHFRDACPLTAPPLGGYLEDATYVEVQGQICKANEDTVTSSLPVRIRVSGQATHLDWTSDAPVFSADIEKRGHEILVTETCRVGGPGQPAYAIPFTVGGDELTLYNGLGVTVLRRERP
jgi:hypothetical protein